jgi:hypothetical protein
VSGAPLDVPWLVLVQPLPSLTDLALGLVTLYLLRRIPRDRPASRYWRAAFVWAAISALAGALHHGIFVGTRANDVSWAITSSIVVIVVSFLLAATVVDVLGRSRAIVFWPLRLAGLVAYAIIAVTGHASITAILLCESVTMVSVLVLWIWASFQGHPMGRPVMVAIGTNIAAALLRLLPEGLAVDPVSAYHLGQIVAIVLLFRAVAGTRERPELRTA